VNAVLAAANARRIDVPMHEQAGATTRIMAESHEPLHQFKMEAQWIKKHDRIPSAVFKKIGVEKPTENRRF
jgi:hypothetical protein